MNLADLFPPASSQRSTFDLFREIEAANQWALSKPEGVCAECWSNLRLFGKPSPCNECFEGDE